MRHPPSRNSSVRPLMRCIWLRGPRSSWGHGQARTGMGDQAVGRDLSVECIRHRPRGEQVWRGDLLCVCGWCSVHRNVALIKCHGCLLLKPCQMAEFVGWHFFSKWSLAVRKGETMKWPNYGHEKAKEHSWLPALLFSPQVFLIACKHAASPFLLLGCEWQRSVREPSHGSACSPSAFSSADTRAFNCVHLCCSLCNQPVWTLCFVTDKLHWFLLHRRP